MIEADGVPAGRIKDRRFLWGILLVGASSIPVLVEVFNSFRGLSENKATGLGAVAGGIAERWSCVSGPRFLSRTRTTVASLGIRYLLQRIDRSYRRILFLVHLLGIEAVIRVSANSAPYHQISFMNPKSLLYWSESWGLGFGFGLN
jgi:hypothetical protein